MAGKALLSAWMLETLAGTVLLKWFTYAAPFNGRRSTVEVAGAGNNGRDGTFLILETLNP